ncbi:MAG: hypothetical protein K1X70_12095 [Leptospirales bacterium]|nr:hypothetical protein [Leptospirales bacterium]HMU83064.1 hypothetical protein [Leptospiraceae bacterium]HNE22098.1 hypothetical protein [Leptospiraceae bacterium]HQI18639.1 hypothetical protein [Leptospiraceae bacterium]
MKRLRLIAPAVAMALATTLVAGPKEDCLQKAKTDHRAAHKECKAKDGQARKDCQKAAKTAFETARKACK